MAVATSVVAVGGESWGLVGSGGTGQGLDPDLGPGRGILLVLGKDLGNVWLWVCD